MTNWKTLFMEKYGKLDLIDRKALLKEIGYETQADIDEAWNNGMSEEAADMAHAIMDAKAVPVLNIIEEFENSGNFEV